MAKTNVVNREYEQLQENISEMSQRWLEDLQELTLVVGEMEGFVTPPFIPQLELKQEYGKFSIYMKELLALLEESQPSLQEEINQFNHLLLEKDTVESLWKAAMGINAFFYETFATENKLPTWFVVSTAEHAIRPFLRKISQEIKPLVDSVERPKCCPGCGEQPRLAVINSKGKKELVCPRCYSTWQEKKISCAHCGNENHEKLVILKVEGDEGSEIHVCNECKGYTKVVDARKLIDKSTPELLDIKSLHLDFIAQEKGYGYHTDTILN